VLGHGLVDAVVRAAEAEVADEHVHDQQAEQDRDDREHEKPEDERDEEDRDGMAQPERAREALGRSPGPGVEDRDRPGIPCGAALSWCGGGSRP